MVFALTAIADDFIMPLASNLGYRIIALRSTLLSISPALETGNVSLSLSPTAS